MVTASNFVINQTKISEQVYEYLRAAIMTGELAPGERLDLEGLVGQLKISKMPIKEAVGRLAAEGLLDIQARRGTYVSRVDERELAEAFEVRRALEMLAGELAVKHVTKGDLARLNALIAEMEASAATRDVREHSDKNFEFHELLIQLSHNRKLAEIYRRLRASIHIAGVHYRSANWTSRIEQEQREHRAIVRALERRDAEAVAIAINQHLKRGKASLLEDVNRAEKPD